MTGFQFQISLRPVAARLVAARLALALSLGLGATFAVHAPAHAQSVLALVNNRPVTSFDVEQRIRLVALTERRRIDRKSALRDLIDDQVKLLEARRVGYRITDDGVDSEFTRLAKNNRQSVAEFSDALRRAGLQPDAMRENIRANFAWEALLRDRSRLGSQVTRSELETAVSDTKGEATLTEYTLVQVLFIVSGGNLGAQQRAASAARGRFNSCETGLDELRSMKDVAVKDPITRTEGDLPKPTVQLLDKTPVGRMTPPTASAQGIELVAVCGKRERSNPATNRSSVAASLAQKKLAADAKEYLDELRKKYAIRYR